MQPPPEETGSASRADARLVAGIVLAAGGGSRFGGPKQLAELDGRPLLEHVLAAASAASLDRLVVVLGAGAEDVIESLDPHRAEIVVCGDWREGQAASLRCGLGAVADADAAVVMLGDGPCISPQSIERVTDAWVQGVPAARAVYRGTPGHPVILDGSLFSQVRALRGDVGARGLFDQIGVAEVVCDDLPEPADVDTRRDLSRLRERAGGPPV